MKRISFALITLFLATPLRADGGGDELPAGCIWIPLGILAIIITIAGIRAFIQWMKEKKG